MPRNVNTAPSLRHIAPEVGVSLPLTRSSTAVTLLYLCADNNDGIKEMMEGEGTELQGSGCLNGRDEFGLCFLCACVTVFKEIMPEPRARQSVCG